MMNRIERRNLKRKYERQMYLSLALLITFFIYLVLIFTTPLAEVFRPAEGAKDWVIVLQVGMAIAILVGLLFGSLYFSMQGQWTHRELLQFKYNMKEEQNKFHSKLFWDAIQRKDFEEAKRLYNLNKFIWGSMRILCNGILMGIATQVPIDKDWKENVNDRMNSYFV